MATGIFSWASVLQTLIEQRTRDNAAANAAAVMAYQEQSKTWVETNVLSRDRVMNVNFTPSPLPAIPHKLGVDATSGATLDLGPFPDLRPPELPQYQAAVSTAIAAVTPDPIAILGQMLVTIAADVSAIRRKTGA